ncbi:hypothetical protein [Bartonella sp. LJL80]
MFKLETSTHEDLETQSSSPSGASYLSGLAERLLLVQAQLAKLDGNSKKDTPNTLIVKQLQQQLDQVSYALVMEYRIRISNEQMLRDIMMAFTQQNAALTCNLHETGRLLMQEIRAIREQTLNPHPQRYDGAKVEIGDTSVSNIDKIIKGLQMAREKLAGDNPHLFQ